ncbi:MAG: hypothetical protein EXS05_08210 [Planctomycetaceae bacterium]|nr:hypothetical protein [Planctomycetaceae bacterium]
MRHLWVVMLASLTLFTLGCNSISSTLLNRTEDDTFFGNSNGDPCRKCQTRPFKGVPITLRVPTHFDIAIKETILLRADSEKKRLTRVSTPRPQLFVEARIVETDKVFTVDVKRPAAGTLDYTMAFGENKDALDNSQYFKQIKSKIVDKTINDVNTALQTILPLLPKPGLASPTAAGDGLSDVMSENRVVAWKRFDLDAPDFEHQVACFLEQHMNAASGCPVLGRPSNETLSNPGPPLPSAE